LPSGPALNVTYPLPRVPGRSGATGLLQRPNVLAPSIRSLCGLVFAHLRLRRPRHGAEGFTSFLNPT
jgi:hypothetical protein